MMTPTNKLTGLHKFLLGISVALLIVSFTQTAFIGIDGTKDSPEFHGLQCFLAGWAGFLTFGWQTTIIWLANPLYFISVSFILGRSAYSSIVSTLAILLALAFMWFDYRNPRFEISLETGYYYWISSIVVLTVAALHFEFSQPTKDIP
jgi:hypothetical protein